MFKADDTKNLLPKNSVNKKRSDIRYLTVSPKITIKKLVNP